MFDIGWSELVVIGVVALVVIGPKELPGVLRTVGGAVAKIRRLAGEFQSQFQEAMREAEIDEARKSVENLNQAASFNPIQTIRDEIKGAVESVTADRKPDPVISVPEPPPVPDLTPEQIKAAFEPVPQETPPAVPTVPVETAALPEPLPPPPATVQAPEAEAEPEAEPVPVIRSKTKAAARKPKASDAGEEPA
ncbi:Sec-independent protein translocase protein TatB [Alsobacter sp. R-9]